jgi:cell division protein ZapA
VSANEKRAASAAGSIEVSVLGRSYTVACSDAERDALAKAVTYLDAKMAEIKKSGKVAGTERIAVTAALNMAHELLSLRLGEGFDVGEARRRIGDIEAKLEAALAKQEKLF